MKYDVYVLCHPAATPIFATQLADDRIISLVPPWAKLTVGTLIALVKSIRLVRSLRPRVVVCGWADARVEWMMKTTGAPRRIGFPMTLRNYYANKVPWRHRHLRHGQWLSLLGPILSGRRLLTDPLSRLDDQQSHLSDWAQIGDALGVVPNTTLPWIPVRDIHLEPSIRTELTRLRASCVPLWIVHPGAGSMVKRWGNENFKNLITSFFIPNNIPCLVIQPPDDPILAVTGPSVVSYCPPDLDRLMAVTRETDAVLCNDSAMSHLAAAMGKRVVALFGPSDPDLFAPYGCEKDVVIKGKCVCRPCMDRCLMLSPVCMELIRVDDVSAKVHRVHDELLEKTKNQP